MADYKGAYDQLLVSASDMLELIIECVKHGEISDDIAKAYSGIKHSVEDSAELLECCDIASAQVYEKAYFMLLHDLEDALNYVRTHVSHPIKSELCEALEHHVEFVKQYAGSEPKDNQNARYHLTKFLRCL